LKELTRRTKGSRFESLKKKLCLYLETSAGGQRKQLFIYPFARRRF